MYVPDGHGDRRNLRTFIVALWLAFLCRGAVHATLAPMWDGFDEPFHLAYVAFVADHGRAPGYEEPSFPKSYVDANAYLPSMVGHGAPTFAEWRAKTPAEREKSRAMAAWITTQHAPRDAYAGANYERQQGPLFYFLAAPFYKVIAGLALPKIVVIMRLFCVLLASLSIPIVARLLHVVAGTRGVWFGLPVMALLPNTPFAVFRISDEALVWPISATIALGVMLLAQRPPVRTAALTAALCAGVWTKLTLLPMFAAVAYALWLQRRERAA
jgi:hypothetical protein